LSSREQTKQAHNNELTVPLSKTVFLKTRFSREEKKRTILIDHFVKKKKLSLLSRETGIPYSTVYKFIKDVKKNPLLLNTELGGSKLSPKFQAFEDVKDQIMFLISRESNLGSSLRNLYKLCRRRILNFPNASFSTFSRYLKVHLGAKKRLIGIRFCNINTEEYLNGRKSLAMFFSLCFIDSHIFDFYCFDEAGFDGNSLLKRAWLTIGTNVTIQRKRGPVMTKLLALLSRTKVEALQVIEGKTTSKDMIKFFKWYFAKKILRGEAHKAKTQVVLLDNGPKNTTKHFKQFCHQNHIVLLYTTPNSPMLNPVESYFGSVKRETRGLISSTR
jgi:transposase